MFTGIIQTVGNIESVSNLEVGVRLRIAKGNLDMSKFKIGDSIAVNGACMTIVNLDDAGFEVDVSAESLSKTCGLDEVGYANLEGAMRLGDTLDGHLVSGHVDGVGRVMSISKEGESHVIEVLIPKELAIFMAYKGSVAIDGISMTINNVTDAFSPEDPHSDDMILEGCIISLNVIPYTFQNTTLQYLKGGDKVNIEIDTIARYVRRIVDSRN
ncbi:riboflavin synthase [Taylorella equigenitalis]|uniref:riboflavin synthase n=1 Tax=Taylorella equigenitalis TaxID=29575 RepID=UPI0023B06D90|nr:riboflavin synthase [Taylorella equigenitalis]WEE00211.1 riboflavin synthase [Taylorella equigenitalis]WEE01688.1 riboflavin synthase [Taylorella equigenitalis]WFD78225.1 riboflavin synthase [Taylorella equigenitalis]WFD79703.1 riboflavin synthase [Taylorella equigenitalis]WFD81179.1 riboflavin synthase [Taylorella equigenitalis]